MINHVRTLLFGQTSNDSTLPGHAMVDPAFIPGSRNATLELVDRALFGAAPDNFGRNYWLELFMRILHSPEFEARTLAFDPRVTYMPWTGELFRRLRIDNPRMTWSSDSIPVTFIGSHTVKREGQLRYRWYGEDLGEGAIGIREGDNPQQVVGLEWTDGVSQIVPLPNTSLSIRFGGSEFPAGGEFTIELLCRPTYDITDIPARLESSLAAADIDLVFRGAAAERDVWLGSSMLLSRMGSFLLAYASQLEQIRGGRL